MDSRKNNLKNLKTKVLGSQLLNRKEADSLIYESLEELCAAANEIREYFCGNSFDLCSILNGKCGKCSEDCKFCAQSVFHKSEITEFPLVEDKETIVKIAKENESKGILRFSIVTSGRSLSDKETVIVSNNYKAIADNCNIFLCASHGLLTIEQLHKLKIAGVNRIHCNLETSRNYFSNICTTHSYGDRVNTIKAAQKIGLEVCSGGIFGLGETWEDRIDMAFELRELGVKSIPVNMLHTIKGTPFENNKSLSIEEIRQIIAIFRFILPDTSIRMAGGRGLMPDKGRVIFLSGANACITGDMLTTMGVHVDEDIPMLKNLGFKIVKL